VIAVVAEIRLYGFCGREGCFAELLRILEKKCESVGGAVWIAFVAEFARRIWLRGVLARMVVAFVAEFA
jgi:hypothetical protein